MITPDTVLQLVVSGLAMGGIYAFIGVGFVTIHNITGYINFAQGEFAMLAAMTAASMAASGIPLPAALLGGVLVAMAAGALVERLAVDTVRGRSPLVVLVMTVAASVALKGFALLIWGSSPLSLPPFTPGAPVHIGGAVIARQDLWVLGFVIVSMVALYIFFERTVPGAAMRACASNKVAVVLVGISPRSMSLAAFLVGSLLAGISGIAVAPITLATYDMGLNLGLKGFVASVVGGLNSAPGAVLGGLMLGVCESLAAGLISSGYKDAIAFVLLLAVLVFRPTGIMGLLRVRRV